MIKRAIAPEVEIPARTNFSEEPTSENHQEDALDEALAETFPSSDPIAISITKYENTGRYRK
jgi:hypothetical protein